mgnify:CR=1 FL=1
MQFYEGKLNHLWVDLFVLDELPDSGWAASAVAAWMTRPGRRFPVSGNIRVSYTLAYGCRINWVTSSSSGMMPRVTAWKWA